jgi:hypothetical protein
MMTDTLQRLVAEIVPRWMKSRDRERATRRNPPHGTEAAAAAWLMRREQRRQAHQTDRRSTYRH